MQATALGAAGLLSLNPFRGAFAMTGAPDTIIMNGKLTTLDRTNPTATAAAITDGVFQAVGSDADIMKLAGAGTKVIDLKGRRAIPA